ncbi:PREDICTED: uncharacterized protein LOC106811372 [Priapulus caudatus]|uniref:Uncharacterized protein LOC106811372 n=1 Tax=Priapulus caudatus TaxID=37621 RepID=A0ABM1EE27_PRICU|nr:PREDICTED: uncharacterized protein LOC106811372 [Priapulus caudatus]
MEYYNTVIGTLPEPQPQNGCGGMLTGVGGVIESPGFPNKYENDTNCEWLIRVHYTKHIFIKILELQLEGGLECNKAELAVIDGYVNRGNIDEHKKAYCGDLQYYSTDAEKTIESERNRVLIKFQTSPSALGNKGFRVVWTEVSKNAECPLFYCEGGETCIGKDGKICSVRTRYCIDPSLVCDGVPNCGEADVSDEASCYFPLMIGICVAGSLLMLALIIAIVIWRRKSPKRSLLEDPNIQLRQLDHSPNMMRTSRMNRSNLSLLRPRHGSHSASPARYSCSPSSSPSSSLASQVSRSVALEDPNIQLRQLDHSPNMMRTSRMNRSNLSLPSPIPSGYDIRELAMHHSPRRGSIRMHRSSRSSPAEETFLHRGEKEKQGAECHFNFMNTFKPIPSPTQV